MQFTKDFNLSYWEIKYYFKTYDLIIVGSGIVGLSTAISYKEQHPKASVLVLERGIFPDGASTKNAGFACFGSAGELLDDLSHIPENLVWETVEMRWKGLQLLRSRLKDKHIGFQPHGGFELFTDIKKYSACCDKMDLLNKNIKSLLHLKKCYTNTSLYQQHFPKVKGIIRNTYEGQIDTGLMMKNLLLMARKKDVDVLNSIHISGISEISGTVELKSNTGVFKARQVVVATNGFAKELLNIKDVKPARAQVLITKPVKDLSIQGTFHFSEGYYYFRNIDNRILFGGGRNLDFKTETTTNQGLNKKIQTQLRHLLKEMILPNTAFEIERQWSGIMGVGSEKKPIIRNVSPNVLAAVRMGGMGIAIGSLVGEKAASQLS